jgi:hypothetical protein
LYYIIIVVLLKKGSCFDFLLKHKKAQANLIYYYYYGLCSHLLCHVGQPTKKQQAKKNDMPNSGLLALALSPPLPCYSLSSSQPQPVIGHSSGGILIPAKMARLAKS